MSKWLQFTIGEILKYFIKVFAFLLENIHSIWRIDFVFGLLLIIHIYK
jgi:hypothetical protein